MKNRLRSKRTLVQVNVINKVKYVLNIINLLFSLACMMSMYVWIEKY